MPDQWPGQVVGNTSSAAPSGGWPGEVVPDGAPVVSGGRLPRKDEPEFKNFIDAGWKTDANGELIDPAKRPTSFVQGVVEGIEKPVNNAVRYLEKVPGVKYVNDLVARATGLPTSAEAEEHQAEVREGSPTRGGGLGNFIGSTLVTLPLSRLPGGAAVSGAATGALLSDEHTGAGVLKDAAIGGAAGQIGDTVVRGIASAVAPAISAVSPNVRLLLNEGVSALTPGQVARGGKSYLSKVVTGTEDRATGQPIVGDIITSGRRDVVDQFNRAVTNRTLSPIGEKLPDSVNVGHDAVKYAGDKLSAGYQDLLPRMSGAIDPAFSRRVGATRARIVQNPAFPEDAGKLLNQAHLELARAFTPNGRFSGRALAQTRDKLDKLAAAWGKSDDPYVREVGEAVNDMRGQLLALVRRQNPADAARLKGLEKGWAGLVQLERAAAGTADGVISPNQYSTAIRAANQSVRKRAVSRGTALNQDLAKAARDVIPNRVGDSGTAGRLGQASLTGMGIGALQAAPYLLARAGTAMLKRAPSTSPTANYVGGLLRQSAPALGHAAAVVPSVVSSSVNK